jgi:hypothetical protein
LDKELPVEVDVISSVLGTVCRVWSVDGTSDNLIVIHCYLIKFVIIR